MSKIYIMNVQIKIHKIHNFRKFVYNNYDLAIISQINSPVNSFLQVLQTIIADISILYLFVPLFLFCTGAAHRRSRLYNPPLR